MDSMFKKGSSKETLKVLSDAQKFLKNFIKEQKKLEGNAKR